MLGRSLRRSSGAIASFGLIRVNLALHNFLSPAFRGVDPVQLYLAACGKRFSDGCTVCGPEVLGRGLRGQHLDELSSSFTCPRTPVTRSGLFSVRTLFVLDALSKLLYVVFEQAVSSCERLSSTSWKELVTLRK